MLSRYPRDRSKRAPSLSPPCCTVSLCRLCERHLTGGVEQQHMIKAQQKDSAEGRELGSSKQEAIRSWVDATENKTNGPVEKWSLSFHMPGTQPAAAPSPTEAKLPTPAPQKSDKNTTSYHDHVVQDGATAANAETKGLCIVEENISVSAGEGTGGLRTFLSPTISYSPPTKLSPPAAITSAQKRSVGDVERYRSGVEDHQQERGSKQWAGTDVQQEMGFSIMVSEFSSSAALRLQPSTVWGQA